VPVHFRPRLVGLGHGAHVVCPSEDDARDEREAGTDALAALACATADGGAAVAADSDVMASRPIAAATIPERAVTERRLNVIIPQLPRRI
jgi:hypothetical protein